MKKSILFFSALLFSGFASSQSIMIQDFAEGLNQPVGIETAPGDDLLYVVEKSGFIRMVNLEGKKVNGVFLNIEDRVWDVGFEQGLLGLAFHPDYEDNGYFYVYYTASDGIDSSGYSVLSRFEVNPKNPHKAKKNTEKILLTFDQPFENHNGGSLHFGPDGYLYLSTGDGGDAGDPFNNAQNPNVLLGKILRFDVDGGDPYGIPATNPFVGMAGYRPEIWDLGLRNPWRATFDRETGDLWIADVGQNLWEEINFEAAGDGGNNYGWRCYEGMHPYTDCSPVAVQPFVFPVAEYMHDTTTCGTITGGYVYRGDDIPELYGKYLYTDWCTGGLWALWMDENAAWQKEFLVQGELFAYTTFGEDVNGELYLADNDDGEIYKIVKAGSARLATGSSIVSIGIYPNPASGMFNVIWNAQTETEYEMTITNLVGQVIRNEKVSAVQGQNVYRIDASQLAAGTYLLSLRNAVSTSATRLMID